MVVVLGTSSGFVTAAPTANPAGAPAVIDGWSSVTHDTSPATAAKITEIGWWCDTASEEANFEVALYAADGASGVAGTRLYVSATNAKGTTAGWKRVTVDWTITGSTAYWLAVQCGAVDTITYIDAKTTDGTGYDRVAQSTLNDPYGGGAPADADGMMAIYVLWESGEVGGTNCQINIGDSFKTISGIQINIGDAWKPVTSAKINIGDSWKTVF